MNLGEKKELNESDLLCKEDLSTTESTNHTVNIEFQYQENDTDEITTTICEEQAKADIYLANQTDAGSKKLFKCPACDTTCTKRSNLRRHIRRRHGADSDLIKSVSGANRVACLLCEEKFSHIVYLKSHLTRLHGVEFDEQEYFFASSDEFLEWKTDLELRTDSVYIKNTGEVKRKDGLTYSYYKCNRSGFFQPKLQSKERKRSLKAYGSVKMNSHCTSVIKLLHSIEGGINVFFCATHYGHDGFKECRDTLTQCSSDLNKRNRKIIKPEDSKMIGPSSSHSMKEEGLSANDLIVTSLSGDSIVSIIMEAGNSKSDYVFSQAMGIEDDMKTVSFVNDGTIIPHSDMSPDNSCTSTASSEGDVHDTFASSQPGESNAKQRLVSNLRKLVDVIENCESDEILDYVASGVDELVNRFTPLIESQKLH